MRRKFTKIHPGACRRQDEPQKVYLRTKNSLLRFFLFIGFCLALTSCFDKGDCLLNSTDIIKFQLYTIDSPYVVKKVKFTALASPGIGLTYNTTDTLSFFGLKTDPAQLTTEYVFQRGTRYDTLILSYTQQTVVLSPDCGAYNYRKDLTVQHSTFGPNKVVVVNPLLLTTTAVNVEIRL